MPAYLSQHHGPAGPRLPTSSWRRPPQPAPPDRSVRSFRPPPSNPVKQDLGATAKRRHGIRPPPSLIPKVLAGRNGARFEGDQVAEAAAVDLVRITPGGA